ncbi:PREDICTED: protein transport protein Sec16A isoform X1 [Hipposideros armiger]|uniref:Protein transport protein sec16 n=1 Tax=Hipposideros armiger TaxID=186990 RepID=A0A8B7R345_HIPAR|nr:PREDICTED: protein transport protein Sec16A isoform X1 [Hipposideros armiger]XP_019495489.1 PREDICTED: protein transport protein Sec16A isoform X1 [Hipposideros armiger]XP_019495498.1 PREDICTED: protein transport protein Sec16A isoform X1 [Hipposideros armiger]XP_019495506.1 PREDICTED: protein transport protein Sec16A isoform X1 [Hipposideros armiger]XP_019495513.1 PREDICTED: protein transport protein Sec16A isoform X1 [Hipposideros armiger]
MQPPPQAVPPSVVGPPPAGTPQSTPWSSSPYRRQATASAPVAPGTRPLQPVTDPFAFSRQALQSTSLGSLSKSSLPVLPGPASPAFLQRSGLPVPHTDAGGGSQGPLEPLPGPVSQPRADAGSFSSVLTPSALPEPEINRSAEVSSSCEREAQTQYIPGAGPDSSHEGHSHGNLPGPDRPPSGQNVHDSAAASAASPFFPLPHQQMPGRWGSVQGGPQPPAQHYWPCPEGPVQNTVPQASSISHLLSPSNPHQGPGHEPHSPLVSLPGTMAGDGRVEAAYLQSGNHSTSNFDLENTFRQNFRVGNTRAGQEFRLNPGVNKEQLPDPAPVNPLAQGNNSESHLHYALGAGTSGALPEADSGALSMFFQGGETENEENLSSEKTGSAAQSDLDGFSPSPGLGHPPAYVGTGGVYQAFPNASNSETTPQGGDVQPFFPRSSGIQHDKPTTENAAVDVWGDMPGAGTRDAGGSHYENAENSEFTQNQEVLPREPPSLDPSSPGDQLRYGPLPGAAIPRRSVLGHAGGGGPNLEALDAPLYAVRPDSVSGYSSKSHRSHPAAARPQDLGTFIQQEVGKPEDDASGSFFKQIDSSPVGGETDETAVSQKYRSSLPQPSTPSPPKPTGIFQTSANSSFEPVKSHLVGVKPVEADRANVVGEVRGTHAQRKKRRPTTVPPDACPGNLEQPPDNMETLFPPQACPLPLTPTEAGQGLGPPSETVLLTPEKRPLARAQGAVKCESPATTLWAQNELPDFGGNVLLAPAAPVLHVPAKPQPSEVIQPPDEGVSGQLSPQPGCLPQLQSSDGIGASENLENPPKMGEEDALPSQASSGYASLLSSPPTESLQNQPVLIAQPDQSYNLAQPIHFSVSLSNPNEKSPSWRDARVGDKPTTGSWAVGGDYGESTPLFGVPASPLTCSPLPNRLAQSNCPQVSAIPDGVSAQPAHLLVQPPSHRAPKSLLPEGQKAPNAEDALPELANSRAGGAEGMWGPPANTTSGPPSNKADHPSNQDETPGALDLTPNRTLDGPVRMYSLSHSDGPHSYQQTTPSHPRPPGPGAHNPDHFYQQVTKDAQDPRGLERAPQEPAPPPPQGPKAPPSEPSNPGGPPAQAQPPDSAQPPASLAPADLSQQLLPRPPQSSSTSVVSSSPGQAAVQADQQWQQPPPDLASYYYHRPLYDGYQSQYPSPYSSDPGTAPLYYQDIYGLYDPRYRPYDSSGSTYPENYRYPEPERPSSRASHCSDRPSARQGYPEGYPQSRGGWSSQSDYYASYYSGQYEYADPGHWDRYSYGSRLRDPRHYDRRYWYDADYDQYRKENYAYADRPEKYWRYDPRFTGSFEDDLESHRDPFRDDGDRRSEHSDHSARSLGAPSRRSSFSTHSQQSQVYRSRSVTAGPYEAPPPPGSFHGDYAYDTYGAPGFSEYGYPADASWPAGEQAPSRPTSPEKFSVPHICARFGPGGLLIKVIPNLPSEGQPALVEVHSMEMLLQHMPEQEEMRAFPGPLGKDDTHKVDVINFAQSKATKCLQNENLLDKESASLLWNFIILLCRQNGTVVGTDIAELLLRDHRTVWLPGKSPDEANLIDFTNEAVEQAEEESGEAQLSFLTDSQAATTDTLEKDTERFRELLLYGRKKDALESAMKNGLWGHALLLASKMDSRTHARVMTRFANSLPINDPLQTVYQLMSGRMPAASTCCGDEKWGDWRPHLAMVLSNLNSSVDVEARTMATMGDTLASKGLLDAAHFCYLMAQVGFGVYTKKTTKLVLIGSNHSLPFVKFATNEAIQRTEAYEYAQSLGVQASPLPNFQVFKFIYSCRLAEMGLATQAFHYCEVIAKSILLQPHSYSPVLISQLVQLASQLRLFDPQLKEKPEEESFLEPAWLAQLQRVDKQVQEGAVVWSHDAAFPQRCPSSPISEVGQCDGPGLVQPLGLGTDNPLLVPPVPSAQGSGLAVQLLPSVPPTVPARVPMFSVPQPLGPVEPGPGCGPPGSARGFAEPSGPDPAALYAGPGLPPGAPCLQGSEHLFQDVRSQDPGMTPHEAPGRKALAEQSEEDFGGKLDNVGSSRMPQDSEAPASWGGASLGALQSPSLTPAPEVKSSVQAAKTEAKEPKKSGESWFSRWLTGKRKTEAYLPDDKNKSIVWDEKKNRWVDMNEPEEEKKAAPPPPMSLPKAPQTAAPGPGGPPRASVNMFSRKAAGTRARYVDVLNPGGPRRAEPALAPADLFAPLAPLPIPAHLCGPNPEAAEGALLAEGAGLAGQAPAGGVAQPEPTSEPKVLDSAASLLGSEVHGSQGGELSRCSSMSSLSREVSQHFNQAPGTHPPAGGPPGAAVPFYSPAQFTQPLPPQEVQGRGGPARGSAQR